METRLPEQRTFREKITQCWTRKLKKIPGSFIAQEFCKLWAIKGDLSKINQCTRDAYFASAPRVLLTKINRENRSFRIVILAWLSFYHEVSALKRNKWILLFWISQIRKLLNERIKFALDILSTRSGRSVIDRRSPIFVKHVLICSTSLQKQGPC